MEVSENKQDKSNKDLLRERFQTKYPEDNFEDEEAYYGKILNDFNDADDKIAKYQEDEKKMVDMFNSDPRSALIWNAIKEGKNPYVQVVRIMGKDGLEAIVNDENLQDELEQGNEEYLKRIAEEQRLQEEYSKNLEETLRIVDEKQKADGLTDDEIDAALKFLVGIVSDGVMGKFSSENIDMALKAINHDADVEDAVSDAEVRGKNAKIEETLKKNNRGDGIPNLQGSNNKPNGNKPQSIFDVARGAT